MLAILCPPRSHQPPGHCCGSNNGATTMKPYLFAYSIPCIAIALALSPMAMHDKDDRHRIRLQSLGKIGVNSDLLRDSPFSSTKEKLGPGGTLIAAAAANRDCDASSVNATSRRIDSGRCGRERERGMSMETCPSECGINGRPVANRRLIPSML